MSHQVKAPTDVSPLTDHWLVIHIKPCCCLLSPWWSNSEAIDCERPLEETTVKFRGNGPITSDVRTESGSSVEVYDRIVSHKLHMNAGKKRRNRRQMDLRIVFQPMFSDAPSLHTDCLSARIQGSNMISQYKLKEKSQRRRSQNLVPCPHSYAEFVYGGWFSTSESISVFKHHLFTSLPQYIPYGAFMYLQPWTTDRSTVTWLRFVFWKKQCLQEK